MQIVSLDLDSGNLCDIEPVLRPLADSDDSLTAAKGRMFLALVRHLRTSGPEPQVVGHLSFDELDLYPWDAALSATATIRPDWYDYGPWEGELPRMHYRVNVRQADRALSRDIRTQEVERVERVLREAFGWDR